MNKKVFLIFGVLVALGLQFSSVNAASEQSTLRQSQLSLVASDEDEYEQDVYNAGEDFYIWTTTFTKVA